MGSKKSKKARQKKKQLFLMFVHYGLGAFAKKLGIRGSLENHINDGLLRSKYFYDALFEQMEPRLLNLYKVLKTCDSDRVHGFAYVFLDPGWTTLLKEWSSSPPVVKLWDLGFFQSKLEEHLKNMKDSDGRVVNLSGRIRIVTAYYLSDIADNVPEAFKLLAGGADSLLYDGPKVVEAAIRIANIGRNIPLFRFDDDVIFYDPANTGRTPEAYARETREAIRELCDHFKDVSADPDLNYFFFSGHYQEGDDYINGFATRLLQLTDRDESNRNCKGLRPGICEKFLASLKGCSTHEKPKAEVTIDGLGANPRGQVVSGAGLCLSDSAILDLPPFSNMRQNIIWIDDHLKYALHHELRHFGFRKGTAQVARVDDATFKQHRHKEEPTLNDVKWHLQKYMIRLILGCVVDKWLRENPEIKLKIEDGWFNKLMEKEKVVNMMKSPGIYAFTFQDVLLKGWCDNEAENEDEVKKVKKDLKSQLWELARKRLGEIVTQWSSGYGGTFLELYMSGPSPDFPDLLPVNISEGLTKAVNNMPDRYPDIDLNNLTAKPHDEFTIKEAVVLLVEDFVDYIDLVRSWKNFVQATRYLLNWKNTRDYFNWIHPGDKGRVNEDREDGESE